MSFLKRLVQRRYLRLVRIRRRLRAQRLGRTLELMQNNTSFIGLKDVILIATIHNERHRLPHFLDYYRNMGIRHFIFVDNNSDDGTDKYLAPFSDVTRYFTKQSYRRAHFGMDWVNYCLFKHCRERWALTVDVDEFFVYPHCDHRKIDALTNWLDAGRIRCYPAMQLDLYPQNNNFKNKSTNNYNPLKHLSHFDCGNYTFLPNNLYKNIWIQGGARARIFFRNQPDQAPALNKTPLVKWKRGFVYISSTHQLLPTHLNRKYSNDGTARPCGVLLHTKLAADLDMKIANPYLLSQHYSRAREYRSYSKQNANEINFICESSLKYKDWRQLEDLGIISSGGWA